VTAINGVDFRLGASDSLPIMSEHPSHIGCGHTVGWETTPGPEYSIRNPTNGYVWVMRNYYEGDECKVSARGWVPFSALDCKQDGAGNWQPNGTPPPAPSCTYPPPPPPPPVPPNPDVVMGDVRSNAGPMYQVQAGYQPHYIGDGGWNQCPAGYTYVGQAFHQNGFWLCARNDLVTRTFLVGDVTADVGNFYRVTNGAVTHLGNAGWNYCPSGVFLGRDFHSNGFWICELPPDPPNPEVVIGDVRSDAGPMYEVQAGYQPFYIGDGGWNQCPSGYSYDGNVFHSNGFWLCPRSDLMSRAFYVGDVTNDAGPFYRVYNGAATYLGDAGWNTCNGGTLVGTDFHPNGFWICMSVCGDGVLDGAEQCDDGNVTNGDCCSYNCQFEPAGNLCGGGCDTPFRCDGAGTCR
jgi:cysteine-rich repeat protein